MSFLKGLMSIGQRVRQIGQKVSTGVRKLGEKASLGKQLYKEVKQVPIVGSLVEGVEKSPIGQQIGAGIKTGEKVVGDIKRVAGYVTEPERRIKEEKRRAERIKKLSKAILK